MSARGVALCAAVVGFVLTPSTWASTVALYHLDELTGMTVSDFVGGHSLTQLQDEPTEGQPAQPGFGTAVGGWTTWAGAYRTTTFPNLTGSWTIEFFFNSFGNPIFDPNPVEFGASAVDRFRIAPNQGHAFEYRTSSFVLTTGYVDYDSNWHHVALTWDAATSRFTLFYDGVLKASLIGVVADTTFLSVGCANDSQWVFAGRVDEVRVCDTVVYTGDFTPPAVPFGETDLGACCHADGSCSDIAAADCTGIWLGAGSACATNPCLMTGACCQGDGTCILTEEWNCPGTWLGGGAICDSLTCLGACCAADYTCSLMLQPDCGGQWNGAGSSCEPNPCLETLTVALYHLDEPYGSTVLRDVHGTLPLWPTAAGSTCAKPGQPGFGTSVGVWQAYDQAYWTHAFPNLTGDWTIEFFVNALADGGASFGDPCPVEFGPSSEYRFRFAPNQGHAFEYRGSEFVVSTGYVDYDANWHHVALTYRESTTELSLFWDGQLRGQQIAIVPQTDYLAIGNSDGSNDVFAGLVDELRVSQLVLYSGDFVPPTQPFEFPGSSACCLDDGWCMMTTEAACTGTWLGAGTSCATSPCPAPTGACCLVDNTCTVTTQWMCAGVWHGAGTTCETVLCPFSTFVGGLGDLPGGNSMSEAWAVSEDGLVVVGRSSSTPGDAEAFRWTAQSGMSGLGALPGGGLHSLAKGASYDGSVVVGFSASANASGGTTEAFRWTASTGMVGLGDLPGGPFDSEAWGVSGDGAIVVGGANGLYNGGSLSGEQAFRWAEADGMVSLGNLSGNPYFSVARAISNDGVTIVGQSDESDSCPYMAFRWTAPEGMVGLGDLPGGSCHSLARGVSADGAVIVGSGNADAGNGAFVWTAASGMVSIGDLPGGYVYAEAWDVSADGSVVVGLGSTDDGERAFIWDAAHGMRELSIALVTEFGLDPVNLEGWTLNEARGISGDGKTIVGIGHNQLGRTEAWIVRLPAARGDLNCDGRVSFGDINPFVLFLSSYDAWLNAYPGCNPVNGDINGDGVYPSFGDINPFVALLAGG